MDLLGSRINSKYNNSSEQRNDVTKKYQNFDFNGVNVAKHWHVARYLPSLIALFVIVVIRVDI